MVFIRCQPLSHVLGSHPGWTFLWWRAKPTSWGRRDEPQAVGQNKIKTNQSNNHTSLSDFSVGKNSKFSIYTE